MPRPFGDTGEQQGTAGDGLARCFSVRPGARRCSTSCRLARPAGWSRWQRVRSLVVKPPQPHWFLSSSKAVFAVGSVAVELGDGEDFRRQRGDENGIFPHCRVFADFREAEPQLVAIARHASCNAAFQPPPQDDHTPRAAPAHKPQAFRPALPALARVLPAVLLKSPFDQGLNILGLPQLEQIIDARLRLPKASFRRSCRYPRATALASNRAASHRSAATAPAYNVRRCAHRRRAVSTPITRRRPASI